MTIRPTIFLLLGLALCSWHPPSLAGDEADPFADVKPRNAPESAPTATAWSRFFSENFGFRKELMSEIGVNGRGYAASRQSVGFEVLKKLSTETKTFASFDFQGRLVRRDGYIGFANDMEGMTRNGWAFEYHNAYADLYDIFGDVGRVNARVGRFYVPFGLNLQTDTHGTILQLSNERNFGFERDWYAGFWGTLSPDLRYDVYYLTGSGYGLKYRGQTGLVSARVSLSGKYASENGIEGGVSVLGGQRLDPEATVRSAAVTAESRGDRVDTLRAGLDVRYRRPVSTGLLTWSSEVSGGSDRPDAVATQLHQLDYLHASRRFGAAAQYRWFWQDMSRTRTLAPMATPSAVDSSLLGEVTWYFQNDVASSNLHWVKLNCEWQLARQKGDRNVITTLQYYRYW